MNMQSTRTTQSPSDSATSPGVLQELKRLSGVRPQRPSKKPRLALRVGVTGHLGLSQGQIERLETQAREVLQRIKRIAGEIHAQRHNGLEIYSDEPPSLRLVSPLAEGADRLVAKAGLAEQFDLRCPLPFAQGIYEEDFKSTPDHPIDTTDEFRELLAHAEGEILELDGLSTAKEEAYEAVGRVVLRNCDLLIAVWDEQHGNGKEKTGGTRQVVRESLSLEIPTIWISARVNREPCLLTSIEPAKTETLENLKKRLTTIFLFGAGADAANLTAEQNERSLRQKMEQVTATEEFFAETIPPDDTFVFKESFPYANFRDFWCWKWKESKKTEETNPLDWISSFEKSPNFAKQLYENYRWSDTLANHYGGLFRSSLVLAHLMSACTIFASFLGFFLSCRRPTYDWDIFYVLEFILIIYIFSLTILGRRRNWHRRWMDYRLLAESLRHVQFLAPLGRTTLSFKVPAHLQPSDPRNSWLNWYFRALVRDGGLIRARLDADYLRLSRDTLSAALQEQIKYHENNSFKLKSLTHRIRLVSHVFFVIAGISCLLHLSLGHPHSLLLDFALNFSTIVLPAFGGALTAIAHHGDFERLETRSEALAERLNHLLEKELPSRDTPSSKELGRAAEVFSEIMFGEALDWRFAFLDKNLELPS